MTDTFLQLVANDVVTRMGDTLKNSVVVFPNKRPFGYFDEALKNALGYENDPPQYYTLDDFILDQSDYQLADNIDSLVILYKVYLKFYPLTDFDSFYGWGNVMLGDFEDIDRNMPDPAKLFKNISAIKDLEKYFLEDTYVPDEFLSPLNADDEFYLQEKSNEIWQVYARCYYDFKKELQKQKLAYPGMVYREVVEKLAKNASLPSHTHYIFIGFNALSKAEEQILQYYNEQGQASVYWDADSYYINNPKEESGYFIRKHIKAIPSPNPQFFSNGFLMGRKNIHIIGAPMQVGQVKTLGSVLKRSFTVDNQGSTAIVLADENLLVPVLYAWPGQEQEINITTGHPLWQNPLFTLFQSLAALQGNFRKDQASFYHKDVLAILSHPLVMSRADAAVKALQRKITDGQLIYIPQSLVLAMRSSFLDLVFRDSEGMGLGIYFGDLLSEIKHQQECDPIAVENLERILKQLALFSKSNDYGLSQKILIRIFKEKVMQIKLPSGNSQPNAIPLMGMLETRCLDFDTVFLLSVNEGILPAPARNHSYIPYDQRKEFGLPTNDEQEHLFAYQFYRLLQRAANIYLFYDSETGSGGNEKSRYLRQIEYYLPKANPHILIHRSSYSVPLLNQPARAISLPKDKAFFDAFLAKNEKGISPSYVSAYFICALRFHFRYVMQLPEREEIVEDLEAKHFGTLFHRLMELSYEDLKGTLVTKEMVNALKIKLAYNMERALKDLHKTEAADILQKNSLLVETVKVLAEKTMELDMEHSPFTLIDMEKEVAGDIALDMEGAPNLHLKGTIDRIDEKDGQVRIVDYKTGTVKNMDFHFGDAEEMLNKENKEAFQALYYGYLYQKQNPGTTVQPVILPLKEVVKGYGIVNKNIGTPGTADYAAYGDKLKSIILAILDPEMPITQTEDHNICASCSYRNFCMR